MAKIIFSVVVLLVVVGGASFYGGMKYAASENQPPAGLADGGDRQGAVNLSSEERRQRFQQMGAGGQAGGQAGDRGQRAGARGLGGGMASMVNGEVIAKDDKSATIKLRDGGSRIIFFSASTSVSRSVQGSVDDIQQGEQIFASGEQNSDGSYTARAIRLGELGEIRIAP